MPRARHFLFKLDRRAAVKNSWLFLFIRWWQRHRGLMGDINFQPITRAMTEWMKKRGTTSPRDSEIRREVTKTHTFLLKMFKYFYSTLSNCSGGTLIYFCKNIVLHGLIRYYTLIKIWEMFSKNFKIKVKAIKRCIFCFKNAANLGLHAR